MEERSTYVGLDVHKESIAIAMLLPGAQRAVEWQMAHDTSALLRLTKKLRRASPGPIACCYEAGPCGFTPQRTLAAAGVSCTVVAPSLIPVKPGERIKTDRRDARKLAELFRAHLLTAVTPPTPAEEAARDLCRCREDLKVDLKRARQRLGTFLLRRGLGWQRSRLWGSAHRQWLHGLTFADASEQQVFDHYLLMMEHLEGQIATVETQLAALAERPPYRDPVGWLRCFRGIDTVTALTLVTELYAFHRFTRPRQLMAYLGLVPSEHSSGPTRHRGALTKAGNSHVRRLLIEAAWHYRHRPSVSAQLRRRRTAQPRWAIALADQAQQRLCRRYVRLLARGKPSTKVIGAVARELVGFVWAALYLRGPAPA